MDPDENSKTIDDLPDDIILTVFSKLPVSVVKSKAALVCKRWHELSKNNTPFKFLEVRPWFNSDTLVTFLREVPCLRKLKLVSRNDVNEILDQTLSNLRKLRVFKVNSGRESRYSTVKTELALRVVAQCPELASLTLKRVNLSDSKTFFQQFGPLGKRLKKINFNHSTQFGTEALEEMTVSCGPLEDVRIYGLEFNRVGSVSPYNAQSVIALCHKMEATLTVLKLNMLGVGDEGMEAISRCRLLKRLFLFRCVCLQDEGLKLITRLGLEDLVVTVPRAISTQCWCEVFSHPNMKILDKLTVSNSCTLDDSVLSKISANMSGLSCLSLPGCRQFTSRGVEMVIAGCPRLTLLNLFSTRSSVAESFSMIPEKLPNLRILIYRPNETSVPIYQDIFKQMPNLEVRESYRYA